MNILITHSTSFDFKNDLYTPIRTSDLDLKHSFILPHESSPPPFTRLLMESKQVDLMIAEVSFPSTGQGMEIGWAQVFQTPVVCLYKKGSKYSSSLKFITKDFIEYQDSKDMITKIAEYLEKYAKS